VIEQNILREMEWHGLAIAGVERGLGLQVSMRWTRQSDVFCAWWWDSRAVLACSDGERGQTHGGGIDVAADRAGCARRDICAVRKNGTPVGAQLDILGDRMIGTCTSRISR